MEVDRGLYTLCKQALEQGIEPPIDYMLLHEARINILGKVLTFK